MKKLFYLVTLMLCLASPYLFAATTADLVLSGVVPEVLSLTSTSSAYSFLPAGATEATIATLTIQSNQKVSYTISLTSANSFALATADVTTTWPYILSLYDGATKLSPTSGTSYTFLGKTPKVGKSYTLKITYAEALSAGLGDDWLDAGSYTDTVTFSVTAL